MKLRLVLIALMFTIGVSSVLAETFNFTFSQGPTLCASGTLIGSSTNSLGPGWYNITGGTLTLESGALGSLPSGSTNTYALLANINAPGTSSSPSGAFIYDDQLQPSAPLGTGTQLDDYGLLFTGGAMK